MATQREEIVDGEISIEGIESIFDNAPIEETSIDDEIRDLVEGVEAEKEIEEEPTKVVVEEETPPVREVTSEEEPKPKEKSTANSTSETVKELIELGILEDVRVSLTEEDEEGTLLSENETLTKEQIRSIIKMQKDKKEQESSDKTISKDNLSEHHLKIIEIMRNGGDLSEVFQNPNQVKRPFEGKDLTKIETQREVAMTYFTTQKGHTPKEAQALIQQKEKDFELDTFSQDVVGAYNKAYDSYLDKVSEGKKTEKQERAKLLSDRKKELTQVYKERGLKDNVFSSVVQATTQEDSEGKLGVHKALEEILSNPKDNYDVLLHMLNKKAYQDLYKLNTQKEATQEVLRLFDAMPKDKSSQRKEQSQENMSELEQEIANIRIT